MTNISGGDFEAYAGTLTCVIADPLRFKRKLRIGEDAYAVLRLKNGLQELWDAGGVAGTAATVVASKAVAGTFFASSAGVLSAIGIGTAAATPVGWIVAAAALTGGAYYGVSRLVRQRAGAMVETIPRFINTPIDLLGMQLLDLIGALALRVSAIDGEIAVEERSAIERHFVEEWGFDVTYTAGAIDFLSATTDTTRVKTIARTLAEFQRANPDCRADAMQAELLAFLRDVVEADGVLDEREELAIDAIAAIFREQNRVSLTKVGRSLSKIGERAGSAVGVLKGRPGRSSPTGNHS